MEDSNSKVLKAFQDQRPFSRFRLPWLTARPAPAAQPPRPAIETIQAPAQPLQRPPIVGPRPQYQPPQMTEPQPVLGTIESQVVQPSAQTQAASTPTSPTQVVSQPESPSKKLQPVMQETSKPPVISTQSLPSPPKQEPRPAMFLPMSQTSSQPFQLRPAIETIQAPAQPLQRPPIVGPRPQYQPPQMTEPQPVIGTIESQIVVQPSAQTQAASMPTSPTQVVSQPESPSKKIQPVMQETSKPPVISTQSLPSAPKQEPRPAMFLPMSQTSSQPFQLRPAASQPTIQETSKRAQTEEAKGPAKEESLKKAIMASETAAAKAKESTQMALPSEQQQQETKKTTLTSSAECIKAVSSTHAKTKHKSTESYQKSNGEQVSLQKQVRDDAFKFVHKLGVGQLKSPIEEKPVSIVTIAGENKGASMYVTSEQTKKDGSIHIHRGYKSNPDDTGTTTDADGNTKEAKSKTKQDQEKKAYVNSNAQSINNSMLLETNMNERNPGVHLILSCNGTEPIKPSAKPELFETHKAEFNVTPAQKLTYEPTIRRRCLRGLFLEPSDSDPDNPDKTRRHGCRYSCGMKSSDKDIGVL